MSTWKHTILPDRLARLAKTNCGLRMSSGGTRSEPAERLHVGSFGGPHLDVALLATRHRCRNRESAGDVFRCVLVCFIYLVRNECECGWFDFWHMSITLPNMSMSPWEWFCSFRKYLHAINFDMQKTNCNSRSPFIHDSSQSEGLTCRPLKEMDSEHAASNQHLRQTTYN